MVKQMVKQRCQWCLSDPLYIDYHDNEWGVPVYDDNKLFEMLILEGMQAGLSWLTVLKKRRAFRQRFADFVPEKVAKFSDAKLEKLLTNPEIIRHRLKVFGARKNAQAFLAVQKEQGRFATYIWQFTHGKPITNHWKNLSEIPSKTEISCAMAKDLKKRGFTFVGSTICYAFMQAVGMVNDHTMDCFCRIPSK